MKIIKLTSLITVLFITSFATAQDHKINADSMKIMMDKMRGVTMTGIRASVDLNAINNSPSFEKPKYNIERFNSYNQNLYMPQAMTQSPVRWYGDGHDGLFSRSRTAIAVYSPFNRMNLHSSATIGMVETPFFGRGNYYILEAGAKYLFTPNLVGGLTANYNSNFNVFPYWQVTGDMQYIVNPGLTLDASATYMQTANNNFGVDQKAILLNFHARQKLTDDWYVNAYGGMPAFQKTNFPKMPLLPMFYNTHYGATAEYWFKPTVGAEAGLIWVRDAFSGKMRAQPKLELKFRPGR